MRRLSLKKFIEFVALSLLAALSIVLAGCRSATERITVDFGEQVGCLYDSSNRSLTVEYGAMIIIPDAAVVDKNGNTLDYETDYTLYDGENEEMSIMSSILNLDRGEYTLIYSAPESKAKDLTIKISVIDEAAPTVTITSVFVNAGSVGDTIVLPTFRLEDVSGVNQSATQEKVTFNGTEIALDNRSFVAENEGIYYYELTVEDNLGTSETKKIPVTITQRWADGTIGGNTLMTFDSADYNKNVMKLYDSTEETTGEIVETGIPKGNGGINPSGNAYKIVTPDNNKITLLIRNNKTINSDGDSVGNIVFRVYTDESIESIKILSPDGQKEYVEYKYVMSGWNELTLNAHSAIGWYDDFGDFLFIMENEDAVTFYLDEVFYTEQWKDSDRAAGVLADFDEEGYLELVENNQYSSTSKFEILTESDKNALDKKNENELTDSEKTDKAALENANGGVLKVTANSSYDGFRITFAEPVSTKEIVGIKVRIYFPEMYKNSSVYFSTRYNFLSNDGYVPNPVWGDLYNNAMGIYQAGWKDYWRTGPSIKQTFVNADSDLVVGFYFAFVLDDVSGATFYVDEITVVYKSELIENDVPTQAGDKDGNLADFTDEAYATNVIPATDKGLSYYYSANPVSYGYATFNDGKTDTAGVKLVHGSTKWTNGTTKYYYYEGLQYVLPQSIVIRNSDNTPRMGTIVLKAYFEESASVVIGVANAAGINSGYANSVSPTRTYSATVGWNEFSVDVKGLINEGIYDLSSIYILTRDPGTWYLVDISYTAYIPPYDDPQFMTEFESGYYLLADFDESDYEKSLSVSNYGTTEPQGISVTNVTLEGSEYGVVELKPSNSGYSGFDLLFYRSVNIASKKSYAANYIYFRVYSPVALDNAGINVATIVRGQYSEWGHYVTPKRITYKLEAGWNVIKLDVKQLAEEGITDIDGLSFTVSPVYPINTAEADKVFYIDSIYMDTEYDASRATLIIGNPEISAAVNGTKITFTWTEAENATSYVVRVNDGKEISVSQCSYVADGFDADSDFRFTVIARRNGSTDVSTSWFYDKRFNTYSDSYGGIVLALFDNTNYDGTFTQVEEKLSGITNTLSDFTATSSGMKISTYGYSKSYLAGGFTYKFPFAVTSTASKTLTFSLSYLSGLANPYSFGQYSSAFFGLIDSDGNVYNAVKYSSVNSTNTTVTSTYYEFYNQPNPRFTIDLEAMLADNPQMKDIAGLYFSHNKSVTFTVNYIVYDNGKTVLEAPVLTLESGENGYVVSWTEVPEAVGYEVKLDGEPIESDGDCSVTFTKAGIITVKALGGGLYNDSAVSSLFIDSSYRSEKGDGYYYLSNFDDERATALISGYGSSQATYGYTSEMTGSNLDIETKGITVSSTSGGSVKYTLLSKLDLTEIQNIEFVIRQNAGKKRGNNYKITFVLGDKTLNITSKVHNVGKATGSQTLWSSMLGGSTISCAYNCIHFGIDVQKYLTDIEEAFGEAAIDGIIINVTTKESDYVIIDEIFYNEVEKEALSSPVLVFEKTSDGYTISWDEVENAEGYEVKVDGEAYEGYTSGTSFSLSQSGGVITVKALAGKEYSDSEVSSLFIDPSYQSEKGDGYYYLSDFNNEGVATMFEGSNVSWNDAACGAAQYKYFDGYTGKKYGDNDIETKGMSIAMPGTYGSVKYNLPENFDLSKVDSLQFVLRQHCYPRPVNISLKLTSGEKLYTITGKLTNINCTSWVKLTENPITSDIYCFHVGFDVQKYLTEIQETLGGTTIDGIIICVQTKTDDKDGLKHEIILDEIFYSKVSEPSAEEENEE